MRIVVADDSPKDYTFETEDEFLSYIRMPENSGWNAGRALVISQVETEFFVWCDDDFLFNEKTNLRYLCSIEFSSYFLITTECIHA